MNLHKLYGFSNQCFKLIDRYWGFLMKQPFKTSGKILRRNLHLLNKPAHPLELEC